MKKKETKKLTRIFLPIILSFHRAIVKEVGEDSQASSHDPPVKVGDILIKVASDDVTRLNLNAINKRIAKARRPVRFDFESGEGADLLADPDFDDDDEAEEEEEEEKEDTKAKASLAKMSKGGDGNKGIHDVIKGHKKKKNVKKAGGFFSWGKKKVAPEK